MLPDKQTAWGHLDGGTWGKGSRELQAGSQQGTAGCSTAQTTRELLHTGWVRASLELLLGLPLLLGLSQTQSTATVSRRCWWLPTLTPQHTSHTAAYYLSLTDARNWHVPHGNSKRKGMCWMLGAASCWGRTPEPPGGANWALKDRGGRVFCFLEP